MTRYVIEDQEVGDTPDALRKVQDCNCDAAWKDRGMVDPDCWYHDAIDVIETLREYGWTVTP